MSFVSNADVLPGSGKKELFGALWGGQPCKKPFDAENSLVMVKSRPRAPARHPETVFSIPFGFRFHHRYLNDL
jgi:hypothetical protein